ncbi:hypothetical protein RSc3435 [Ralstonia pseudosolanacearum GMI1000]|uniref:Uncharacterized protein n=1 Tax=Ralstonia nicotianae (strain ATCC BAA-1114 / GMI1000) TaxID=267608 RepID=Q8XTW1_RALN1|nr:hypothetical protein RSc3435 [Ralstonia pseudosolanacearum GMI1000]
MSLDKSHVTVRKALATGRPGLPQRVALMSAGQKKPTLFALVIALDYVLVASVHESSVCACVGMHLAHKE